MAKKIANTQERREVLYLIYDTAEKIQTILKDKEEKKRMSLLMSICFNTVNEPVEENNYVICERYMTGFIKQWADNNGLYSFPKI